MALAKLKRSKEELLEELTERVAADINRRAEKMNPQEREKADAETKRISDRVQHRTR